MVILVYELTEIPQPYLLPSIKIYFFASFFAQGEDKKTTQGRQVETLYGVTSFSQQPCEGGIIGSVL